MIDIGSLTIEELEQLRDACNRRLLQMRQREGLTLAEILRLLEEVKQALSDQGKQWRSLERWQWIDGKIRFWLNPSDQALYRTGWYSIDELIAWLHDTGPVLVEPAEDFYEEEEWEPAGARQLAWVSEDIDELDPARLERV